MQVWFISDTHFGHANIIKYCNRPFKSIEEMDAEIVKRWNERVAKDDIVYFLGDFCFKRSKEAPDGKVFEYYRDKLNGNIIFIQGNHDRNNGCKTIMQSALVEHGGEKMLLLHDSKRLSSCRYRIVLCGHVHEKWQIKKLGTKTTIINMSVDVWDYRPQSINDIISRKAKWHKEGGKE